MSGITHVIRGEEFALEYSLYRCYCDKFKLPAPKFIFLSRLEGRHGDISKTAGGYSIAELRGDGYTAQDIKDMLAKAGLSCPQNGWYLYNLKREPRIDL
jgi:glutamyl/glutaminyl-tRNA synthetase